MVARGYTATLIRQGMTSIPGKHFARNLVTRRALVYQMMRRDFQQRFVGSAAGWLWGIVHPGVMLLTWTYVFQVCLGMTLPKEELTQNYPIFLICGFLPWLLFQETVQRSSMSLIENSNLITKTVFPSEVIPISIFLSSMLHHLLALGITIVAIAIWLHQISPMLLLLPLYMVLIGMFAVGIGWVVAGLQVYIRDTAQVVTVVLNLWYWLTPIMIAESKVPQRFRFLVAMNPMSYVVHAYRARLLSTQWPSLAEFAVIFAYAAAALVIGGLFFRQLKRGFADVL